MRAAALTAIVLASALALSACGGSSKTSTSTASSTTSAAPAPSNAANAVSIQADPNGALRYVQSQATAKAGTVTIKFSNPSQISHGLSLQGPGVSKAGQIISPGTTSTLTLTLKPGTYTYFCPVPGHRQAGMQGTLTVK